MKRNVPGCAHVRCERTHRDGAAGCVNTMKHLSSAHTFVANVSCAAMNQSRYQENSLCPHNLTALQGDSDQWVQRSSIALSHRTNRAGLVRLRQSRNTNCKPFSVSQKWHRFTTPPSLKPPHKTNLPGAFVRCKKGRASHCCLVR